MMANKGEIEVFRHTPGDTEIYITKLRSNPYVFEFAIKSYTY